jgi:hypothetical protein
MFNTNITFSQEAATQNSSTSNLIGAVKFYHALITFTTIGCYLLASPHSASAQAQQFLGRLTEQGVRQACNEGCVWLSKEKNQIALLR